MKACKFLFLFLSASILICCNNEEKTESNKEETKLPRLKEESITYTADTLTMNGYVVYDENLAGARPAVLVVHEWWGLTDYPKMRARQLAEMGYIAMAVDMYGNGKTANDPKEAEAWAMPFYMHPDLAMKNFDAAVARLKTYPQADTGKLAAIGYCFGGGVLLNLARMGENIDGVVSFHGSLLGTPPKKELLRSKILVCHGEADQFVPVSEVQTFKHQMDSIGANMTFKSYPGATHAFTNPDATATGKKFNLPIAYNAAADSASWSDMKSFLNGLFK
jgi:dienelactone hydrolase